MRYCFLGLCLTFKLLTFSTLAQAQKKKLFVNEPNWKPFAISGAFIVTGALLHRETGFLNRVAIQHELRSWVAPNFRTHADDYLQYTPIVGVYALDAMGVRAKNDLLNRTILLLKSELIAQAISATIKTITHEIRPDSSNSHSFPSGHTTQAFAAATFFHKEFGQRSAWYSVGAYTVASSVGVLRMLNNKHWISDVLVGAGIGIFGTQIAYQTHRYRWGNKRTQTTFMPFSQSGATGMYMCVRF